MPKTISMINWKGGVGKTTASLHLGVGIRNRLGDAARVLLVDLDPQCNLSYLALGLDNYVRRVYRNAQPTLKDVYDAYFHGNEADIRECILVQGVNHSPGKVWRGVDILLSHQELILLDLQLARTRKSGADHRQETYLELEKLRILANALRQVEDDYTHVIFDCPPNVNLVTQNAFVASTHYLVPAIPDFLSTVGISLINDKMREFDTDFAGMHEYARYPIAYTPTEFLGIFFNMVDERSGGPKATHSEYIESTKEQHEGMVFDTYVTDGDGVAAAASVNFPVYSNSFLPRAKANATKQGGQFMSAVDELLARLN